MPRDLLHDVDALARRTGRKRSQLVRDALHELLEQQRRSEFDALLAEGYQAMSEEASAVAAEVRSAQDRAAEGLWRWDE